MEKEIRLKNIFKLNEDQYYCEKENELGGFEEIVVSRTDAPTKYLVMEIESKDLTFGSYDDFKQFKGYDKLEVRQELEQEIASLEQWFTIYYTIEIQKYEREKALGIELTVDIVSLYNQAEVNRDRIKELRNQLKEN